LSDHICRTIWPTEAGQKSKFTVYDVLQQSRIRSAGNRSNPV